MGQLRSGVIFLIFISNSTDKKGLQDISYLIREWFGIETNEIKVENKADRNHTSDALIFSIVASYREKFIEIGSHKKKDKNRFNMLLDRIHKEKKQSLSK